MDHLENVLEKTGRILTEQYGIRIVCEGNRCATDGRTIYLPALPDDVPTELWDTIRGYCDHEVAHHVFRSSFAVGKEFRQKHGNEAFGMLNILEDLRVENGMKQRFPGSRANLDHAYAAAEKSASEKADRGEPIPYLRQLAFAVTARAQGRSVPKFVEPTMATLAGLIEREAMASVVAPNTKAVAALAETAWATVQSYLQAMPPQETATGDRDPTNPGNASATHGGTSGGSPGGDGGAGSPGIPTGGKKRRQKNQEVRANPTSTPSTSAGTGSGDPGDTSPIPGSVTDAGGSVEGGIIGGLAGDIVGAVNQHATATGAYRVWSRQHDKMIRIEDTSGTNHAYRMAPLMRHTAGVRQKLLQSLMAESRVRWRQDMEDGVLNPRALHRLSTARFLSDDPGTAATLTRRIFRKKVVTRRLQTAVTLLIDVSHSMSGKKLDLARGTAMVLCEALARLNIPVAVWAFSTEHQGKLLREAAQASGIPATELEKSYRFAPVIHERFKDFDEPFKKISGRFDQLRTHLMTPLGESMLFAASELARRREPRKVLLVLTDGRPTVGLDNDIATYNHAHEAIRRIERAGMDVLLVGIIERCVLDLHHRAVVVDQLDDLPRTVMNQMRKC